MFVNPVDYEFLFPVHARVIAAPSRLAAALAGIAACYPEAGRTATDSVRAAIAAATPDEGQRAMAAALQRCGACHRAAGCGCHAHPQCFAAPGAGRR